MNLWEEHLLPRAISVLCGSKEVGRHRKEVVVGLGGSVVEIGFGSGLNVPFYPAEIARVYAVDPSNVGRRLSRKRVGASQTPVEFVGLDGQNLPLEDASVDAALSTLTLCTIPDPGMALRELYRVVRPGGTFHFLEHGLALDADVARKQMRFNRFQQRVAGGCTLIRPIDQLISEAGFEIGVMKNDWMKGPKVMDPWGYLYMGVATKP